ncbi:hypothetical protein WOLCODRAFT_158884 [Wolfiporia cocos MD-104 SS10]|uniref:Retrotransposon gag domain-containing protein n=1 Tax=Wolfiporia cocos (strain MD-104) TaxID=742152 RepID=A0A2H3JKI9_WOLCO|nr:hypothetical protein WOLCODRAFT_158884 [Wolfiporia cocos MD-104 SS10]
MDALADDFGRFTVCSSNATVPAPAESARVSEFTLPASEPLNSVQGPPAPGPLLDEVDMAFRVAQHQSNTWAFPPNPTSHNFGLACQQIAAIMVQTGVWSADMAAQFLREGQRLQADALAAGDAASQHSQHPPPKIGQTNPFLPSYTPPVLTPPVQTFAQVAAPVPPLVAPQAAPVNTWGAMPLQGTRASMWRPEEPASSQWDAYSLLPEPTPDPRYKSKVREPGDFDGSGFTDWYMRLKLCGHPMIRGKVVDSWVTAFTREHYLSGQWWISWSRFIWELHQKFDDLDLEKKAAVAAEKLTMTVGKGEDYFQELERLLAKAKCHGFVHRHKVHCWITSAIPKEIYNAVHQAFVAATVNDKSQRGYNVKIPEDYESWKQAILRTNNVMRRLRDEEKLRHGRDTKGTDKGKERARTERPKTEPMAEERANLLKRACHSCKKTQAEAPGKGCNKPAWHQPNWKPHQTPTTTAPAQRTRQLTDGNEAPKVLSEVSQEDFV